MARYYPSRRRRYTRPYSVSFRFNRTRRGFNRQRAGAMTQRDTGRFLIKAMASDTIAMNAVNQQTAINIHNPFLILANSSLFGKLKECFDQVKVNGIRVKLVPTAITSVAGAYIQSVIAWDRNGNPEADFDMATTYGSAKMNIFTTNTKTTLTHFIGAETIGEKTQYMQTSDLTAGPFAWNPQFFFGIRAPVKLTQGQTYSIYYAMEWSFDCTFRGTRTQ